MQKVGLGLDSQLCLGCVSPEVNGIPVAAFLRTILTLVAGAGLMGGGFIAATMSPELREAIGGLTAKASTPPSLASIPNDATSEFGVSDLQTLAAEREQIDSNSDWSLGPATTVSGVDSMADEFLGGVGTSISPPVFDTSPRPARVVNPANEGLAQAHSLPPLSVSQGTDWHAAARTLSTIGVTTFNIYPTDDPTKLRCDCWVVDGQTRRQLSGEGATPVDAVVDAAASVREFRNSASWFTDGTSR